MEDQAVHKRLVHLCRKCGWRETIPMLWADLKPRKCPDCGASFVKEPDMLLSFDSENPPKVEFPEEVEVKKGKKK
jgi:hypothetical protein